MGDTDTSSAAAGTRDDLPTIIARPFTGSCHCSFIRYRATIPQPVRPIVPTATRCNCTICLKTGFTTLALPNLDKDFELLHPNSWEEMGCYRGKNKEVARYFCPMCGVNVVGRGRYVLPSPPDAKEAVKEENGEGTEGGMEGGSGEGEQGEGFIQLTEDEEKTQGNGGEGGQEVVFFAINLVTLDQPQEGLDLSTYKMEYCDGRNDNWMAGMQEHPWPGGVV